LAFFQCIFGNLEGPISARGKNQGSAYSFRFEPVGTINALKYAGFDLVNLANNHIYDYGLTAAKDTMGHLTDAGISYVGFGKNVTEANSPVIKKIGSANVAFLGYTEFYGESARAGENKTGLHI
jgi:poly-gamma-glutamate synthesis protein (capsule biosynthesis protein)